MSQEGRGDGNKCERRSWKNTTRLEPLSTTGNPTRYAICTSYAYMQMYLNGLIQPKGNVSEKQLNLILDRLVNDVSVSLLVNVGTKD